MSTVTKPIALDETLQTTNTRLQAIANALGTNLTANKAVVTDSTGKTTTTTTTATEIGYVAGVTSNIQTQLNNKETADDTILKQANITDNVTSTSTTTPLSANQGKLLNDRINNLENIGRFLAIWNCATGLPLTNPTSLPYTYKTGDYYRVGAIAGSYTHALSMAGSTTSLGTYEGTYTLAFNLATSSATQLTTVAMVISAMDDSTRYSATGTLTTSDNTYTIASVIKWIQDGTSYIAICDASEEKLALITTSTTHTDTVTGGTTNYKPNGDTYTGSASVTVETEDVEVGWVYYFDGTNWLAQSAGAGGTVQDVQINGTTIVASDTGIANIPKADGSTFGVFKTSSGTATYITGAGTLAASEKTYSDYTSLGSGCFVGKGTLENVLTNEAVRPDAAQSLTTAQQAQARTNINAITMEEYDSTATPEDNVLYYVIED